MSLARSIHKAYKTALARGWDTIYVLVDVHDTVACSNYRDSEVEFYPEAIAALKKLSAFPEVHLILWTCCYEADYPRYLERFEAVGVKFHGVNSTPVANTRTGCFDKKPYFSVLIDDKAGFDPSEWDDVAFEFWVAREESKLR